MDFPVWLLRYGHDLEPRHGKCEVGHFGSLVLVLWRYICINWLQLLHNASFNNILYKFVALHATYKINNNNKIIIKIVAPLLVEAFRPYEDAFQLNEPCSHDYVCIYEHILNRLRVRCVATMDV